MNQTVSEQKSRLQSMTQQYENLIGDGPGSGALSADEQAILARISEKLEEIKRHLDTVEASPEPQAGSGEADEGSQKRKSDRLARLKEMRSSISGLMASLKSAR